MVGWDDLRYFLAVARLGTTAAAGRMLEVDATTVARRISALERGLGTTLFERRIDGYRLIGGEALLAQAERAELAVSGFLDLGLAHRRAVEGWVRVTGTEVMATHLLGPAVARVREKHPAVRIEVIVEDRKLDLVRGEADVALRVGSTPAEPSLVAKRMPDSCWSVYCSKDYAARRGRPTSVATITGHTLIAGEGPLARVGPVSWLESIGRAEDIACRCNTLGNLIAMTRAGAGVAALPCVVGEDDDRLLRCISPPKALRGELWLLYHESQRGKPAIRAFLDELARELRSKRPLLDPGSDRTG